MRLLTFARQTHQSFHRNGSVEFVREVKDRFRGLQNLIFDSSVFAKLIRKDYPSAHGQSFG